MTDDLIARLEAATEGSRELDWEIAKYLGWSSYWSSQTFYLPPGEDEGSDKTCLVLPAWSRSIDAALTLVPPGWRLHRLGEHVQNRGWDGKEWWWEACFWRPGPRDPFIDNGTRAPTPALALCIAALKARSTT